MLRNILVAILVVLLDRVSKSWALNHLSAYQPHSVNAFLNYTLSFNTGAAFSFMHNESTWPNIFFSGLAIVVGIFIVHWMSILKRRDYWKGTALALILGGAMGNAWDRFVYRAVIDFISFHVGDWHFAIFNIADTAITIGAAMLVIQWVWEGRKH